MRSFIAVALASVAVAAPSYGGGGYAEKPYSPHEYPAYTPSSTPTSYVAPTTYPEHPKPYPTKEPEPYPSKEPEPYPSHEPEPYPSNEPEPYPSKEPEPYPTEEPYPTSSTITVTLPYPTGSPAPYPSAPAPYPSAPAPYPSSPAGTGYPPAPPAGTGYPPAPPAGTGYPSSTGSPVKPSSYPTEFPGAASNVKAAGFVAGVGAFAALFL